MSHTQISTRAKLVIYLNLSIYFALFVRSLQCQEALWLLSNMTSCILSADEFHDNFRYEVMLVR